MNSVTTRVVAFAISTLGIVFSDDDVVTRQQDRPQPESAVASASAEEQNIIRLMDIADESITRRLPLVSDSVETMDSVVSADRFWDIVKFRKKNAKSELRMASSAEPDDDLGGQVTFTKRLPNVETGPQDATAVPGTVVDGNKGQPPANPSQREITSVAAVPLRQHQEYSLKVPQAARFSRMKRARDAAEFYRQHAPRAKSTDSGMAPVLPKLLMPSNRSENLATPPALVASAPSLAPAVTPGSKQPIVKARAPVEREKLRFTRLPAEYRRRQADPTPTEQPERVETRGVGPTPKFVATPAAAPTTVTAPPPEVVSTPQVIAAPMTAPTPKVVATPAVANSPSKAESRRPATPSKVGNVKPSHSTNSPPIFPPQGAAKRATTKREVQLPIARVSTREASSNDKAAPAADTSTPSLPTDKRSPAKWSPLDLKNIEIAAGPETTNQRPKASQASREAKGAAQQAVQQAFELAQRRAHYSARAKFIGALRIVAHSLDDQSNCTDHTASLRNALQAFEEVTDFFPDATRPDRDVNLYAVIGGHNTELLQKADPDRLTPSHCLREYLAYAEQEFAAALGHDPFASQALYGLGRLEAAIETAASSSEQVRAYRSLMLYQTALLVDSQNFAAANELGVALARHGKYEAAIQALRHCVRLSPQATAWTNLARIHEKLGEMEEARLAQVEATRVSGRDPKLPFVAKRPSVEWVDANTFVNVPQVPGASTAYPQPATPDQLKQQVPKVPVRTAKQTKRPWFFNFGK